MSSLDLKKFQCNVFLLASKFVIKKEERNKKKKEEESTCGRVKFRWVNPDQMMGMLNFKHSKMELALQENRGYYKYVYSIGEGKDMFSTWTVTLALPHSSFLNHCTHSYTLAKVYYNCA